MVINKIMTYNLYDWCVFVLVSFRVIPITKDMMPITNVMDVRIKVTILYIHLVLVVIRWDLALKYPFTRLLVNLLKLSQSMHRRLWFNQIFGNWGRCIKVL